MIVGKENSSVMENYREGDVRKMGEGIHLLANRGNHMTVKKQVSQLG